MDSSDSSSSSEDEDGVCVGGGGGGCTELYTVQQTELYSMLLAMYAVHIPCS